MRTLSVKVYTVFDFRGLFHDKLAVLNEGRRHPFAYFVAQGR
jgi:hypothetical protein